MESSSEEKSLPASKKKLRDQRNKGVVSTKTGLVDSLTFVILLMYLLFRSGDLRELFESSFLIQTNRLSDGRSASPLEFVAQISDGFFWFVLPVFLLTMISAILVHGITERGFIFAVEKLKVRGDFLSLDRYFKNIFSKKGAFEVLFNFSRLLAGFTVVGGYLYYRAPVFFRLLLVEFDRQLALMLRMMFELASILALLFLLFGLVDYFIQKRIYLSEQKMTKSEAKRETINTLGNPQVKQAHRAHRQRLLSEEPASINLATIFIAGGGFGVGLRYVPNETPIPVLVAKAKGINASRFESFCQQNQIKIKTNSQLASKLYALLGVGESIRPEHFSDVAEAIRD